MEAESSRPALAQVVQGEAGLGPAVAAAPLAESAPSAAEEREAGQAGRRLVSLDAFRGLTILGMLLVNNAALDVATPAQLTHAGWNQGVHFADLVFPWFVLILGVAIPYAAASFRRRGLPLWRYDLKVFGRAAALVLLGCLIDSSLARRPLFDLGVLQLIGLSYFAGAMLYELPARRRLLLAAGLLLAHWAVIRFLAIPGVGAGAFTAETNVIAYLNQIYLQPLHLRGLLSVLPTSALALMGTIIGDLLRSEAQARTRKPGYLIVGGGAAVLLGWLWNLDLPFNKAVWTPSYIVYAGGWGAIVLGLLYLMMDVNGWRRWGLPLTILGMNAITAYAAPILVKIYFLQGWTWKMPDGSVLPLQEAFMRFYFVHAGRIQGGWLYTFSFILFWWLVTFWMYRKRIFLRV